MIGPDCDDTNPLFFSKSLAHASSGDAGVWRQMRGTPFLIRLFFGGLLKPEFPILGNDIAGREWKRWGKPWHGFSLGMMCLATPDASLMKTSHLDL